MELEFFCKPDTDLEWFQYWKDYCVKWLKDLGMKEDFLRARDHDKEELSFYSKATTDLEFLFPFGWGELWGIADRTNYDLSRHQEVSGEDMNYFDEESKEKYIPYVIEPSLGADRVTLAFLCNAYDEEQLEGGDVRTVLHFHPALAPVKIAVLPCPRSCQRRRRLSTRSSANTGTRISTTEAPSASATEERTRSARPTA